MLTDSLNSFADRLTGKFATNTYLVPKIVKTSDLMLTCCLSAANGW